MEIRRKSKMGWKDWIKGLVIGVVIDVILFLIQNNVCSDFYRIGPAYPTNQPICYFLTVNGGWIYVGIIVLILSILLYGRKSNKIKKDI